MGWSLEAQIEKVQAKGEQLIRQRIHDEIVDGGGDPTSPPGLHAIDNYRPAWSTRDHLEVVFSSLAILRWSKENFPQDAEK